MPVVTPSAASMLTVKLVRYGEVLSLHHRRQPSCAQRSRVSDRQTRPRAWRDHEVDVGRPHQLGGHDQVAFVLAVLVVDDHDHAAGADSSSSSGIGAKGIAFAVPGSTGSRTA
jgi:hypothetical protein